MLYKEKVQDTNKNQKLSKGPGKQKKYQNQPSKISACKEVELQNKKEDYNINATCRSINKENDLNSSANNNTVNNSKKKYYSKRINITDYKNLKNDENSLESQQVIQSGNNNKQQNRRYTVYKDKENNIHYNKTCKAQGDTRQNTAQKNKIIQTQNTIQQNKNVRLQQNYQVDNNSQKIQEQNIPYKNIQRNKNFVRQKQGSPVIEESLTKEEIPLSEETPLKDTKLQEINQTKRNTQIKQTNKSKQRQPQKDTRLYKNTTRLSQEKQKNTQLKKNIQENENNKSNKIHYQKINTYSNHHIPYSKQQENILDKKKVINTQNSSIIDENEIKLTLSPQLNEESINTTVSKVSLLTDMEIKSDNKVILEPKYDSLFSFCKEQSKVHDEYYHALQKQERDVCKNKDTPQQDKNIECTDDNTARCLQLSSDHQQEDQQEEQQDIYDERWIVPPNNTTFMYPPQTPQYNSNPIDINSNTSTQDSSTQYNPRNIPLANMLLEGQISSELPSVTDTCINDMQYMIYPPLYNSSQTQTYTQTYTPTTDTRDTILDELNINKNTILPDIQSQDPAYVQYQQGTTYNSTAPTTATTNITNDDRNVGQIETQNQKDIKNNIQTIPYEESSQYPSCIPSSINHEMLQSQRMEQILIAREQQDMTKDQPLNQQQNPNETSDYQLLKYNSDIEAENGEREGRQLNYTYTIERLLEQRKNILDWNIKPISIVPIYDSSQVSLEIDDEYDNIKEENLSNILDIDSQKIYSDINTIISPYDTSTVTQINKINDESIIKEDNDIDILSKSKVYTKDIKMKSTYDVGLTSICDTNTNKKYQNSTNTTVTNSNNSNNHRVMLTSMKGLQYQSSIENKNRQVNIDSSQQLKYIDEQECISDDTIVQNSIKQISVQRKIKLVQNQLTATKQPSILERITAFLQSFQPELQINDQEIQQNDVADVYINSISNNTINVNNDIDKIKQQSSNQIDTSNEKQSMNNTNIVNDQCEKRSIESYTLVQIEQITQQFHTSIMETPLSQLCAIQCNKQSILPIVQILDTDNTINNINIYDTNKNIKYIHQQKQYKQRFGDVKQISKIQNKDTNILYIDIHTCITQLCTTEQRTHSIIQQQQYINYQKDTQEYGIESYNTEQSYTKYIKCKEVQLGQIRFIGHLLNQDVYPSNYIIHHMESMIGQRKIFYINKDRQQIQLLKECAEGGLVDRKNLVSLFDIECVCEQLQTCGRKLSLIAGNEIRNIITRLSSYISLYVTTGTIKNGNNIQDEVYTNRTNNLLQQIQKFVNIQYPEKLLQKQQHENTITYSRLKFIVMDLKDAYTSNWSLNILSGRNSSTFFSTMYNTNGNLLNRLKIALPFAKVETNQSRQACVSNLSSSINQSVIDDGLVTQSSSSSQEIDKQQTAIIPIKDDISLQQDNDTMIQMLMPSSTILPPSPPPPPPPPSSIVAAPTTTTTTTLRSSTNVYARFAKKKQIQTTITTISNTIRQEMYTEQKKRIDGISIIPQEYINNRRNDINLYIEEEQSSNFLKILRSYTETDELKDISKSLIRQHGQFLEPRDDLSSPQIQGEIQAIFYPIQIREILQEISNQMDDTITIDHLVALLLHLLQDGKQPQQSHNDLILGYMEIAHVFSDRITDSPKLPMFIGYITSILLSKELLSLESFIGFIYECLQLMKDRSNLTLLQNITLIGLNMVCHVDPNILVTKIYDICRNVNTTPAIVCSKLFGVNISSIPNVLYKNQLSDVAHLLGFTSTSTPMDAKRSSYANSNNNSNNNNNRSIQSSKERDEYQCYFSSVSTQYY